MDEYFDEIIRNELEDAGAQLSEEVIKKLVKQISAAAQQYTDLSGYQEIANVSSPVLTKAEVELERLEKDIEQQRLWQSKYRECSCHAGCKKCLYRGYTERK